jgi:hypothetical protein
MNLVRDNSKEFSVYFFLIFGWTFFLSGCSLLTKPAIRTLNPVFIKGENVLKYEDSFQQFEKSTPALLTLFETLSYEDPGNTILQRNIARGYFALGFFVHETKSLKGAYENVENNHELTQAKKNYEKALKYSMQLFENEGFDVSSLELRLRKKTLKNYLEDKISNEEKLKDLFYFGSIIFSLINLEKDNPMLLSKMELAFELINFSCSKKEDLEEGMCLAFRGAYLLGRPKMLGGDKKGGVLFFKEAFEKYPQNLFLRALYMEKYAIYYEDEKEFKNQLYELGALIEEREDSHRWKGDFEELKVDRNPTNLFFAVARERFKSYVFYGKKVLHLDMDEF